MKGFWKTAFLVFALLIAVPLVAIGCGKNKEGSVPDGQDTRHIVSFECTKFENEDGQLVPIGQVSVRALNVVDGATITTNGNTLTIGKANVTATPVENDAAYVFSFENWEIPSMIVNADITIKANFKRETAVYRIILDANARQVKEELPTNLSVAYNEVFPTLPDLTAHGYSFMTDEYHFGWSIDKDVSSVEDNVDKGAVWGLDWYSNFEESNNYQRVEMNSERFERYKYYVKDENTGKYVLAKDYVHGLEYYISKHDDLIDWTNHTITLYAQWRQNYITINLCKDVTEWDVREDGVIVGKKNGKTMVNDVNMQIALFRNGVEVAKTTSASGKAKFTGIDLVDENGDKIEYSVYAKRSQYAQDNDLIDTGRKVKAYWNGQDIVDFNAYITYYSVTLETCCPKSGVDNRVEGQGLYLPEENASISATPAPGYSFIAWEDADEVFVTHENPYTFAVTAPIKYIATFDERVDFY